MLQSLNDMFLLGVTTIPTADTSTTGVSGIYSKILGIILLILIIVFATKLIGMFQQRQYAQLIVLFLVGAFAFWFVMNPNGFITFMSNMLTSLTSSS